MATKASPRAEKKPKSNPVTNRLTKSKALPSQKSSSIQKSTSGKDQAGKSSPRSGSVGARALVRHPAGRTARDHSRAQRPIFVPRAMPAGDDDDVLMALGAGGGAGFGRCGGRLLGSRLEQNLCDRLSQAGVAHSHSPRHFEIRFKEDEVAAYAPMIVLRGRGREGKSVVIECAEEQTAPILRKVSAFRAQYGQEFYVILVAPDEVLEEVEVQSYDESCAAVNVNTLISRLAE